VHPRAQRHAHRIGVRLEPVLERVFHERLQQQRRHRGREQRRIALVGKVQLLLVPLARHAEVVLDERDFVAQQRGGTFPGLDRVTQHVREALGEALRRAGVGLDQVGERVERIEEEVRLHLRLQRPQLGARRGLAQFDGAALGGRAPFGEPQVLHANAGLTEQAADRRAIAVQERDAHVAPHRGAVRADYFWGTGEAAGRLAGRMRQAGKLWLLWPKGVPLPRP
jgi:hypothetical protein